MSQTCKFCGADMENAKFDTNYYKCGSRFYIVDNTWWQDFKCLKRHRDNLEAEVKQLRDEDATDPIDERLAAAGKIFRELVAEREELRREMEREAAGEPVQGALL